MPQNFYNFFRKATFNVLSFIYFKTEIPFKNKEQHLTILKTKAFSVLISYRKSNQCMIFLTLIAAKNEKQHVFLRFPRR